jgi:hypothetical protein
MVLRLSGASDDRRLGFTSVKGAQQFLSQLIWALLDQDRQRLEDGPSLHGHGDRTSCLDTADEEIVHKV